MQKKWDIRRIAEAIGLKPKRKSGYDCNETLQHVMRALDNELTVEEEKEFLAHVNCCSRCLEKYKIEKSFKTFLSEKIVYHRVSSNLVEQIRIRIRNTMDRS